MTTTTTCEMKPFKMPRFTEIKNRIHISFSGGKTSAYMTKMLLDHFRQNSPEIEILVVFANTGQEHEETLTFIDRCDKRLGFNTIWLEAEVSSEKGVGTSYKIVTYETASRNGQPYADVIAKYGIPNQAYNHCTRETKLQPMTAYFRAIGWKPRTYSVAVGIRADEMDRMSPKSMESGVWYPCIDAGVTKDDVREWWAEQSFNLNIPEHLGNCTWCWKKSNRKLLTIAKSNPEMFDFPARMEAVHGLSGYKGVGYEAIKRTFFRGNRTALDILAESQLPFTPFSDDNFIPYDEEMDAHGSCGDSCEVGADKNDFIPSELPMTTTTTEYRVEMKDPERNTATMGEKDTNTTTVAKAYHGTRCIGRFTGIHAKKQAEALIELHRGGATEASLELCAADIGFKAVHDKSLRHHPMLIPETICNVENQLQN